MKQKIILLVLLAAGIYLPVSSRECGKVCISVPAVTEMPLPVNEKPAVATEEISSFPASPFSRALFSL